MELIKQNFIVIIILLGFTTKNSGKENWFYFFLFTMREEVKVNWKRLKRG